ncbi:hypothetical protein D3C71_1373420 [compost metagenome]
MNCRTTSIFRALEFFNANRPFNTLIGSNFDKSRAGYILVSNNVPRSMANTLDHSIGLESCREICFPEKLLNKGRQLKTMANARVEAMVKSIVVSNINWKKSSFLPAPITLRIPTSLARDNERAVERLI